MTEVAAENMETEFENTIGPGQNEVVNKATRDLIKDENEKLRRELESLKKAVKNNKHGANKKKTTGAASKKNQTERMMQTATAPAARTQRNQAAPAKKLPKKQKKPKETPKVPK